MIRTLLAHGSGLARGALALVLDAEADIDVVGQVGGFVELAETIAAERPRVAVLDFDLVPPDGLRRWSDEHATTGCVTLVLADPRKSPALGPMLAGQPAGIGFVANEGPPARLVSAVRRAASGEPVLDPELVVTALRADNPLTDRERNVLSVAAEGAPAKEIAARLGLSSGTVRNHLSRVLSKTNARTRIEAVRLAQDAGWI